MKKQLRVLFVEDVEADALLVERELKKAGWDVASRRVDTEEGLRAALAPDAWDVVVCDWSMPSFDAPAALRVVQSTGIDVPFVIVSGQVGEESAVTAMKAGAHDYVMKGDLRRLAPAVERELREAVERRRRRDSEAALRDAETLITAQERLATIGTLAAGIVHEINNPLAALLTNLEAILQDASGFDDDTRAALTDSLEAARHIQGIAADVRMFSRTDDSAAAEADVKTVVSTALRMARTELIRVRSVETQLEDVPTVAMREGHLVQVVLNLLVNAAHAVAGRATGGRIVVRAARTRDERVELVVVDDGPGIPPEVRARLFTPFFTTKAAGRGTGLGLHVSQKILENAGGRIEVDSDPGDGATFRVVLPAAAGPAGTGGDDGPPRVLVVDDDRRLARALGRCLQGRFHVAVESDPCAALARVARGERFDVVLSDFHMPGKSGGELRDAIAAIDDAQAAAMVFMTGALADPAVQRAQRARAATWIEKPFAMDELERALRTASARAR